MDCRSDEKTENSFAEPDVAISVKEIKLVAEDSGAQSNVAVLEAAPPTASEQASAALRETFASIPPQSPLPLNLPTHATELNWKWPQSRQNQVVNCGVFAGFTAMTCAMYLQFGGQLLMAALLLSGIFFLASFYYAVNYRKHVSLQGELPRGLEKSLRYAGHLSILALLGTSLYIVFHDPFFSPTVAPEITTLPLATEAPAMTAQSEMEIAEPLYHRSKYEEAIPHYKNAVRLDPKLEKGFQRLSDIYTRTDPRDGKLVIAYADKALALNPNNLYVKCTKAYGLNLIDRYQESLDIALSVLKVNSRFGEAYATSAYSYEQLHQLDKALVAANMHMKYHGYESEAYEIRASVYTEMGRKTEAAADMRKVEEMKAAQGKQDAVAK